MVEQRGARKPSLFKKTVAGQGQLSIQAEQASGRPSFCAFPALIFLTSGKAHRTTEPILAELRASLLINVMSPIVKLAADSHRASEAAPGRVGGG